MSSRRIASLASFLVMFGSFTSVSAAESGIRVSGFLTAIAAQGYNDSNSTYANGLAVDHLEWDTRDNHLGIQFANSINPQMDVTAQFITRGGVENYNFEADWAYIDYKALSNVRFRIGKYKIPQFLASDYLDVGYAYPWVRPPQDVYGTNPLISLNGIDMLYTVNLENSRVLFDFYIGDGTHKTVIPPATVDLTGGLFDASKKGSQVNFDTHKTRGISIKYVAETFTLRAGYFKTIVDADLNDANESDPNKIIDALPGAFGGVGFTMDVHDIIAYAEYIRRNTDPGMAGAFPDQDAWYTTLGYRFGKILPTLTYSKVMPGLDESPLAIEEKSIALGLRYDIADSADIKFEALHVVPKEGNHGLFNDPVAQGNVYTASFDVIF